MQVSLHAENSIRMGALHLSKPPKAMIGPRCRYTTGDECLECTVVHPILAMGHCRHADFPETQLLAARWSQMRWDPSRYSP